MESHDRFLQLIQTPLGGESAANHQLHPLSHTSTLDAAEYVFFSEPVDLQSNAHSPWLLLRMTWSGETPCARFGFLLCEDGLKTKYQYGAPSDDGYGRCVDESGGDGHSQMKISTHKTDVFTAERLCDKDPHCRAFSWCGETRWATYYTDPTKSKDLYPTERSDKHDRQLMAREKLGHSTCIFSVEPRSGIFAVGHRCLRMLCEAARRPTVELTTDCSKSFESHSDTPLATGSTDAVWCSAVAQQRKELEDASTSRWPSERPKKGWQSRFSITEPNG